MYQMIPLPTGFTVVGDEDETGANPARSLVLYPPPPGGRDLGEVHYLERAGDLRPVETIIKEAVAGLPGLEVLSIATPEQQLTAEGEYATFVSISGRLGHFPLKLYLGIVFADDFVSLLRVLAWDSAALETVARELLYRCRLGLGVRRRRFRFEPPPGWSTKSDAQVVTFYPPDFPENLTSVTVFPANPLEATPQSVFETWLEKEWQQGFIVAESLGPWPVASRYGVHGCHFRITGRYASDDNSDDGNDDSAEVDAAAWQRDLVILQQAPYLYMLRLDTARRERLDEHLALFRQIVSSVQPVPSPVAGEAMEHWAL